MQSLKIAAGSLILALSASFSPASQAETLNSGTYFQAQNSFAHSLLRNNLKASKPGENIFLSPLSANLALSMLLDGARGSTQKAMLKGLGFDPQVKSDELHQHNADYIATLNASDSVTLSINNGLWVDKAFPLETSFAGRLDKYYQATVANEDFRSNAVQVAGKINDWASASTNGKIPAVIDADTVKGLVLLLANATYFKGTWSKQFAEADTRQSAFAKEDGQSNVEMMNLNLRTHYIDKGYQAIRLPYEGNSYSMYVVLPPKGTSARAFTANKILSEGFWRTLDQDMSSAQVELSLPKFRVKNSAILNDSLAAMGFTELFHTPNLTGLSRVQTRVSFVKQDSFIEVNESGTEAAAVTTIGVEATSVGSRPKEMRVDRPFFIAIRDDVNKTFVFTGFIADPQW